MRNKDTWAGWPASDSSYPLKGIINLMQKRLNCRLTSDVIVIETHACWLLSRHGW